MNFLKSFLILGGIAAVTFLQSPMTQTSVEARGGALHVVPQGPPQVPAPLCDIGGYSSVSCARNIPGCTGGTFKGVLLNQGANNEDFKRTGTSTRRGNCTGNEDCFTPASLDVTSAGC